MEQEFELLNKIYTDTESFSKALNCVLPKVTNPNMRKVIIGQINECDKINSDAKCEISNLGKKAKSSILSKFTATVSSKVSTIANASDSVIAEFIIKEANNSVISITKAINKSQNSNPECYSLGKRLIKKDEECISNIMTFL